MLFLIASAAARPTGVPPTDSTANPLYINPDSVNFAANPEILERILSGPHGYFRFINIPFSQYVCTRLGEKVSQMPSMNLHGDAHLEQYAVTDIGRGLTDYDDSSTGPGVLDLLRVGVSTHLVAAANHWTDQSDSLFSTFLSGYLKALQNPDTEAPEPQLVKRIRAGFSIDRVSYFEWIASVMQPVPEIEADSLATAFHNYVETKQAEKPEYTEGYFRIVECGRLEMGIGSALDMKFLIRIAGSSDDPLDDVVLECKEVRDLSAIDCIDSGREMDPFRILLGQTRIAYAPFKHLGYFRFRGRNFWVHSWVDNYKEVKINKSFTSAQDLYEVLFDIGVQLGRGHVKHIASPLDLQLRREQQRLLKENRPQLMAACRDMAQMTVAAWETFVKTVAANGQQGGIDRATPGARGR